MLVNWVSLLVLVFPLITGTEALRSTCYPSCTNPNNRTEIGLHGKQGRRTDLNLTPHPWQHTAKIAQDLLGLYTRIKNPWSVIPKSWSEPENEAEISQWSINSRLAPRTLNNVYCRCFSISNFETRVFAVYRLLRYATPPSHNKQSDWNT